jgi:preprotein translocase subunit YajC
VDYFISICYLILAQTQTTTSSAAGAANAVVEEPKPGFFSEMQYMLPAMLAIMVLYFLLMVRPQQQEQSKVSEKLASLKKNDRVVTAGGILGTVVKSAADSEYTTIKIDEASNTKMQIRTTSIVRVLTDEDQKSGSGANKK